MMIDISISELVNNARLAQKEIENFTQEQIDAVVKVVAKTIFDNAEALAKMAVEETGMGVYEHKVAKNTGKARIIWNSLKSKKSVGVIEEDLESGIIKVAKPMGVIGALTPCTNPIVTPMCNIMFALKGRNAIIIAPHPRAKKCASYTLELINENLKKFNLPKNLIQTISEPSVELTNELMKSVDVIVATGGMGMVKAAYSSGKPSYGVGAGNVQCIIDRDVNFAEAAPKIITGRAFDNGIICSGEQMVIVHNDDYDNVVNELVKNKAYFVNNEDDKNRLKKVLFDKDGVMNREAVGKSAAAIGKLAGIGVPDDVSVILVPVDARGKEDVLCKEKMCPVIGIVKYKSFEEALDIAEANLEYEGKGHSVAIHSNNKDNLIKAGERLPVSRLLVNQICATMNGGSFVNGLAATTTLGCGSWGNNSISENLDYKHFINITRIASVIDGATQPPDDVIWG
ncbi:aldehyde dehydrogenase family protein [Sedimentibacter hydroxybenzoicus DSM 7310]|uniref:Aldehyde dehydrogenase family protein n=1 Tax=Sedimentibacter hydroxybenzoicus DSM 7310 TaxID=1123245 RepID=A0A974BH42_SEDHY|nr:aldehyde dehydrogenase family protein [Sedimentibacter hydroxybenzoicus]NYB72761.1 aldehyde dehydrogenase family protein [Sedimentibacter hydroxybenzoicus DSM 7310]